MTTNLKDMQIGNSECCDAPIYVNLICSECLEHATPIIYNCDDCQDSGEIEIMGDGDNFEWDVVGIKRCHCQYD